VSTSPTLVNPLLERMRKGELGLNLMIRHARTVDIALAAKACGFDGLFFDLQHGVISESDVSQMAVAAMNMGVAPIVRVPEKDYAAALRMLDNGALGIVMPEVTTVEDARWPHASIRRSATAAPSAAGRTSATTACPPPTRARPSTMRRCSSS
jgi:2-keto-3-deoxy-L-rhamnonate aldolase RhmA